jgi:hypothetical protein
MERVMDNGHVVACGDFGRIDTTVELGIDVNIYTILWEEDIDCDLPEYPIRDDYNVRADPLLAAGGQGRQHRIRLRTYRDQPRRRGRNRFFSLRGRNQAPFVAYSNTANNMNHGLKRLLGARDDESEYRNNALKLGHSIFVELSYTTERISAYRALLGQRFPDFGSPEGRLWKGAREFVATGVKELVNECDRSGIQRFLDAGKNSSHWAYYTVYDQLLTFMQPYISRSACADIPHVKKALRQQYVNGLRLHTDDDIMVRKMQCCIKRELAKFGKAPRLFVQYGAGAMYANELPEFIKLCIDGLHLFTNNGKTLAMYIAGKPKSDTLQKLFQMLKDAMVIPNFMQVIIFSDDSCVSGSDVNRSWGFNVDISSNDSSQDVPAFYAVYSSMANFHEGKARGLIDQCLQPMEIPNPEFPDEKITIKFDGPFEGSGTVLTTILNHYASAMNYLACFYLWTNGVDVETSIMEGAQLCGHVVTCEKWGSSGTEIHKVQFLKRSPVEINGQLIPQINLGCVLRSLGSVEDELSAKQLGVSQSMFTSMSNNDRMQRFFSSVIEGWKNETGNSILNALRERFNSSSSAEVVEINKHDSLKHVFSPNNEESKEQAGFANSNGSFSESSDAGLFLRYGLNSDEISELVSLIKNIQLGMHVSCDALAKIYHVDYGMPLPVGMTV